MIVVGETRTIKVTTEHTLTLNRDARGKTYIEYTIEDHYSGQELDDHLRQEFGTDCREEQVKQIRKALIGICKWQRDRAKEV